MMTFPKTTFVTVASVVNIFTWTYATSVELKRVVACVKPASLKVWTCGKSRMYPSSSMIWTESVVLKRTALDENRGKVEVILRKKDMGGVGGDLVVVRADERVARRVQLEPERVD